jgi:uncharacterized protein with PQ loop repeat
VQHTFGDCLHSEAERASFTLGLLSICCWLGAQLPQVVKNARTGTAESLSPFFLASLHTHCSLLSEGGLAAGVARTRTLVASLTRARGRQAQWLAGDTCNLLGCLLSATVLPTQTATAVYYLGMDFVMISQACVLGARARRRKRRAAALLPGDLGDEEDYRAALRAALLRADGDSEARAAAASAADAAATADAAPPARVAPRLAAAAAGTLGGAAWLTGGGGGEAAAAAAGAAARRLLSAASPPGALCQKPDDDCALLGVCSLPFCCGSDKVSAARASFATALAWLSAACYLGSRVAQLRRNAAAKSAADGGAGAEGLSMAMFLTAVLANTLYGTSVLLRAAVAPHLSEALVAAAPWLMGSLGCCVLDFVICRQAVAGARAAARRRPAADGGMGLDDGGCYEPLLLPPDLEGAASVDMISTTKTRRAAT